MNFSDFHLAAPLEEGIAAMGYEQPSPIQEQAIPIIIDGYDLIGCAQTGTGKTAAFLLPVMHRLLQSKSKGKGSRALIIAPTRELAIQIDQQLEGFGYFAGISSIAVYGGGSGSLFEQEKKALQLGADIIVATPGRLLSHLSLGYVAFSRLEFLILDEADRMLDMGFLPDINRIISYLPTERQTLLFSATMPDSIRKLANSILNKPKHINLSVSKPAAHVLQAAYVAFDNQKIALIQHLITDRDLPLILIFAGTKNSVKDIERALEKLKLNVAAIHSDLDQEQRLDVMNRFKNRQLQILVATDIVSRGIDVDDISLVINYNVPGDAEDYIHRVGRTARAEKTGVAITLINEKEYSNFLRIESLIEAEVRKSPLPESIGEGPSIASLEKKIRRSYNRKFKGKSGKSGRQRKGGNKPKKN